MTPIVLTSENFQSEVLQSSEPVLIDFWAPWCAPCRAFSPVLDEIAAEASKSARSTSTTSPSWPPRSAS